MAAFVRFAPIKARCIKGIQRPFSGDAGFRVAFSRMNVCPEGLFMMIRFAVDDGHGPIDLFGENQTDHLMRECHARKRDFSRLPFRRCAVRNRRDRPRRTPSVSVRLPSAFPSMRRTPPNDVPVRVRPARRYGRPVGTLSTANPLLSPFVVLPKGFWCSAIPV